MRIKFLCSFAGKFSDGSSGGNLVYVGGITKVIRLSNGPSWQQLREKTMALYKQPHTIKYQLPGEDLDVLVSVHCDEDLRHMMRFGVVGGSAGSEKLFRLFLFAGDSIDHPNVEVQHSNTSRVSAESKVASGSSDGGASVTDVTFSDPPSRSMSGNSELNHAALVAPDDKGTVSEEKVGESLHVDDPSAKVEENLRATVSENEESAIEEVSGLGGSVALIAPHGKLVMVPRSCVSSSYFSLNPIIREKAPERIQRDSRGRTHRSGRSTNSSSDQRLWLQDLSPAEVYSKELASEKKPQKLLNEKQQENQDMLIKCISCDLGFSNGRPIAACVIYKCLLHWRSFEVERTSVFDRIIQTIGSAIEAQDNSDTLSYWLSNSSSLLLLLQLTLKASGAASMTPQRRRTSSASLFSRISQGLRASAQSAGLPSLNGQMLGGLNDLHQVEAKYPALLFKQQLTAFLEKIYGMLRDNLKKELSLLLGLCIQAPRTSRASLVKGSRSQINAMAQQASITHWQSIAHWQSIVKSLTNYLKTLQANYVPPFLVRKLFIQIFSFINVQLFNSLLRRRECCLFSNGEYVKAGLAKLLRWCYDATEEYAGSAWDELKHIRQAVDFLVIQVKPKKTLKEITDDLCPVLSIQQLYRICTMYWDDKYGTQSVSSDVISNMRVLMTEDSNNAVSSSFLLDDDSGIPFSVDDISKSMEQIDTSDIDPPPLLRENSGFSFLLQRAE